MDKLDNSKANTSVSPRICLFSQRNLHKIVSRCAEYEFEDLICEIDDVELLAPEPCQLFSVGQKFTNRLARHLSVAIKNSIGDSCVYIPPAIDVIRFCPYPNPQARCIDVYSLGRKSAITHQALLNMAEQRQIFYVYDTILKMDTLHPAQHRSLLANIAKRSRYFIANSPKINRQIETGGQEEISYRFSKELLQEP